MNITLIASILLCFVLVFNFFNYYKLVATKKNEIEKNISYFSITHYFLLIIFILLTIVFILTIKNNNNFYYYILFCAIILLSLEYFLISRKLYCFNNHIVLGLNRIIKYSDISKIEFSDMKNKSTITFTTNSIIVSIKINIETKKDLISYLSKKTSKKIYSI